MGLDDVYYKQAFAPSQQLLGQTQQAFSNLPALHQQGMQMKEQQTEIDRLNRPVTPWQKAIMELMNGGDPRQVAITTKAALAGSAGGQGGPAGMSAGWPQMPQGATSPVGQGVVGGGSGFAASPASGALATGGMTNIGPRDAEMLRQAREPMPGNRQPLPASSSFASARYEPSQMPQPSAMDEPDMFSGMTGRDFRDYTNAMQPIMGARSRARESRDRMAEIALQNEGALNVAKERGGSAERVAQTRGAIDRERMRSRELIDELNRRVKEKYLDEKIADNIADNQLGWAKLQEIKRQFMVSRSGDERLKAAQMLLQHSSALSSDIAKVDSTLWGRAGAANNDIKKELDDWKKESDEAKTLAKQFIDSYQAPSEPNVASGSSEVKPRGNVPQGARQPPKVGGKKKYRAKSGPRQGEEFEATEQQLNQAIQKGYIKREDLEEING